MYEKEISLIEKMILDKAIPHQGIKDADKAYLINEQFMIMCQSPKSEGNPSEYRDICRLVIENGAVQPKIDVSQMPVYQIERFINHLYGLKIGTSYNDANSFKEHSNKITGDIFEDYCLNLFPDHEFEILEFTQRRSRWITQDNNRDAKIRDRRTQAIFNIDFKFRSSDWPFTNQKQAQKYVNYDKQGEHYHIIVGKGGKPFNPNEMFIIPLYFFKNYINMNNQINYTTAAFESCKRHVKNMNFSHHELIAQGWKYVKS